MNEEPDGSLQQPVARAAISVKAKRSKKCISKPAPKKKPGRTSGQTKTKAMVLGIELGSLSTEESNGWSLRRWKALVFASAMCSPFRAVRHCAEISGGLRPA
jgi:hypothetical protein